MGWFSNAVKNLRPDRVIKDPRRMMQAQLDPAGTIVRAGRTNQNMPGNARTLLDPGGFFDGRQSPQYPTYQPGGQLRLSANAQKLYDQMKARTAQRQAAQQPQATPQQVTNQMINDPRFQGRVMADGGSVRKSMQGCEHFESKAFERKKNGKPS